MHFISFKKYPAKNIGILTILRLSSKDKTYLSIIMAMPIPPPIHMEIRPVE